MEEDSRSARQFDPEDPDRVFWFEQLVGDRNRAKAKLTQFEIRHERMIRKLKRMVESAEAHKHVDQHALAEAETAALLARLGCGRQEEGRQ